MVSAYGSKVQLTGELFVAEYLVKKSLVGDTLEWLGR